MVLKLMIMKDYINIGLLVVLLSMFSSCETKDVELFHGQWEIYFEKFYMNALSPGTEEADSTSVSFFFYPEDTKELHVPLVVLLSGEKLTADLQFALRVISEGTTAKPEEYALADTYTFHAYPVTDDMSDFRDTISVTLKYSDRLESLGEKGVRLVVELVPNTDVALGQFERRRALITWSNVVDTPTWWDKEVEKTLLGVYSYEKYKLFLEVVEGAETLNADLIQNDPAKARSMVESFKKWLINHLDDPDNGAKYNEILNSLV